MIEYKQTHKQNNYSNKEFLELKGYLSEKDARVSLAKFLYNNLGITFELLTGIRLFPYQEIVLRNWFKHNFCMNIWSRGGSKSFLVAVFCCLYPLFNKNAKIILTSNSFRATRGLMITIEGLLNSKGGQLLRQCFTPDGSRELQFRRGADEIRLNVNGGFIVALPMNNKLRGFRASVVIADEAAQIPEDIYKSVLVPFLSAKDNVQEQLEIQEIEDELIKSGDMKEEDRTILGTDKKIIALSSASYDFEFLYRLYAGWVNKVLDKTDEKFESIDIDDNKRTYFVSRFSYKALPKELVEKEIAEEAKSGDGENSASFQREWMALFSSSSDGFFNIKRLHDNTIPHGELPCVQLKGNKDSKYILAIDPNFSASKSSDYFAMGVFLLNDDERTLTQVHSYAVPGGKLKDHIQYLFYLVSNFNIIFITADLSGEGEGFNFIQTCNESAYFADRNLKLDFIEGDFNNDENYLEELRKSKNSYNLLNKRIVYRQVFNATWLRKANEHLQSQIDRGKMKFASPLIAHDVALDSALKGDYRQLFPDNLEKDVYDWADVQDNLITQTKAQLALIEVKTTASGNVSFDLPQNLRRSKSPERARKDNYSVALMATWLAKCYWDMIYEVQAKQRKPLAIPRSCIAKF